MVQPAPLRRYATAMSARAKSLIAGRGARNGAACQRAAARYGSEGQRAAACYRSEGPPWAGASIGPRSTNTGAEPCS